MRTIRYFLPDAALDEAAATLIAERLLDVMALTLPTHAIHRPTNVTVIAGLKGEPGYCCYAWGFFAEDGCCVELLDHHAACNGSATQSCDGAGSH